MSKRNHDMTTRSVSKKVKWSRNIKKKDFNNFSELLEKELFTQISIQMDKQVPSWDDSIDDYIDWSNASPQPDPTASLQKQGLYSEYTMSLSLCKKSHLAERTGKDVSTAVKTPWVTVKKSALENAGLGLFAARRFVKDEIVTIYYAPKKSKEPIYDKYAMKYHGWYITVPVKDNEMPPYYMGAHFINDATYNCEDSKRKGLERSNNCRLEGLLVKARGEIRCGEEIKVTYDNFI